MSSQAVGHILFGSSGSSLPVDWLSLQQKDPAMSRVLNILHQNQPLDQLTLDNPELTWMFRERSRLVRKDGVLYRRRTVEDGENLQLVLPNSLKLRVLQGFHDELGHLGRDKTLDIIRQRFCWPGMEKDVDRHIASCERCIKRKSPDPPMAPMVPILAREPMELLAIDFLSLEKGKGGFEHVLVVTDSFTKYSWAFPTHNQQAPTVAKLLWENILVNFGFPQRLHSDQGRDFESRITGIYAKWLELRRPERPRITHKGMAKQSGLIEHFWACLVHWMLIRRMTGQSTYCHWSMPTTVQDTRLQGTPPISSCLVVLHAFRLM